MSKPFEHAPCTHCGQTETPLWRKGPDGTKSLCNGCGVHFMRHKTLENKSTSPSSSGSGKRRKSSHASGKSAAKTRKRKLDDMGEVIVTKRGSKRSKGKGAGKAGSGKGSAAGEGSGAGRRGRGSSSTSAGSGAGSGGAAGGGSSGGRTALVNDDETIEYDAFAFLEDFLSLLVDGDNDEVSEAFLSHLDYMDIADLVKTGEGLQIMSNAIMDQLAARASASQQQQ